MRRKIGMLLAVFTGWLLMAAMVLSPWLRGSVPPWAIMTILWLLAGIIALWVAGLILLHGMPTITPISIVAGLLMVQGWIMAANPVSHYQALGYLFVPQDNFPLLPGSVDGYSSALAMISFTILLGIFHVVIDCWSSATFRNQFLWAAAITGASVAFLGILQKTPLNPYLPWDLAAKANDQSEFGPYAYHASAACLMLATLPIALTLAVSAWTSGTKLIGFVGSLLSLLILGGIFANTARAGVILAIPLTIFLAVAYWRIIGGVLPGTSRGRWLTAGAIVLVVGLGIAISAVVMPAKWVLLIEQIAHDNPRLLQWRIVLPMAGEAGPFGDGPNTFALKFPVYWNHDLFNALYPKYLLTYHNPGDELSIWSHAHSDPLQWLVEYGWLGAILWLIMPIWTGVMAWRQIREPGPVHLKLTLLGPIVGWMSLMAYCTFDFPMQILSLQLYAVVFMGIIWSGRATQIRSIAPVYSMAGLQRLES